MSFFSNSELNLLRKQFNALEPTGSNVASMDDLSGLAKKIGIPTNDINDYLKTLGHKPKDLVSFDDFIKAAVKIKENKGDIQVNETNKIIRHHGYKGDTMHTIDVDECASFTNHVNSVLSGDPLLSDILPIDPYSEDILEACSDGIILAKLINHSSPNNIDMRVLNVKKPLSAFQIVENLNLVLKTAESLDISIVNIGAQDIIEGRAHLLFGLIWQVIKLELKQNVGLVKHPELYRLLKPDESVADLVNESPEASILRWVNYHLNNTPHGPVTNLSNDFKDGKAFLNLLSVIEPGSVTHEEIEKLTVEERSKKIIDISDDLNCTGFLNPAVISKANPKLNFAFLADLLDKRSGLRSLDNNQLAELDAELFSVTGQVDSEVKHFLLWINSNLANDTSYVKTLDDLNDGIVLLRTFDSVYPGTIDWKKRVNTDRNNINRFNKLENTNYLIELCKSVNFSLVGIQGADITEKHSLAVKSVLWQLMRASLLKTIASISPNGVIPTDADVVFWANNMIKRTNGKHTITSCKDPSIRTGLFFIELLNAIVPNVVNKDLVTKGQSTSDARLNAQYAISIARKLGVSIFTLPEDITDVNAHMVFVFICVLLKFSNTKSGDINDQRKNADTHDN